MTQGSWQESVRSHSSSNISNGHLPSRSSGRRIPSSSRSFLAAGPMLGRSVSLRTRVRSTLEGFKGISFNSTSPPVRQRRFPAATGVCRPTPDQAAAMAAHRDHSISAHLLPSICLMLGPGRAGNSGLKSGCESMDGSQVARLSSCATAIYLELARSFTTRRSRCIPKGASCLNHKLPAVDLRRTSTCSCAAMGPPSVRSVR